jgi:NAD(P)-dependent dehydrogenase (short-subunit alcohol dehydrogenase family)
MKSLRALMNLNGRVAIITGGAGHIGQAIGDALAELGASIVVLDINEAACESCAKRIEAEFGVETMALVADLANERDVMALPEKVLGRMGRIDILINNAAFVGTSQLEGWTVPFPDQLASTWRLAIEVNLTAPFVLIQACLEALRVSGHGSIINVGSVRGMLGVDERIREGTGMGTPAAAYAASKGGLIQFTRYLSTLLAPDIRVNAVSFGGIERNQPELFQDRYCERTPLGRLGTEEDAKGAFGYLASDLSAYVTGHNLVLDGGWTVW